MDKCLRGHFINLLPTALTLSTYYRRNVISGACGTVSSTSILKTVYPNLSGGTIGVNQSINYGSIPAPFTSISLPSGGNGSYTYQWQTSIDNITWTNINGATATQYSSGTLTSDTYFRRTAINICGNAYSNTVTINDGLHANANKDENYIYTVVPNEEAQDLTSLFELPQNLLRQNIVYYDGLGRPKQNNAIFAGPSFEDIITPIIYDGYGREAVKYLPYPGAEGNSGNYVENPVSDIRRYIIQDYSLLNQHMQ